MISVTELPQVVHDVIGAIRLLSYPEHQGATSRVAFVTSDRGAFVIKHAQGTQWSAWLAQEWRVLRALTGSGLTVPRALHFEQTEADQAWLVMSHLEGVTIGSALQQTTDRNNRDRLLQSWGAALAKIHRTAVPSTLADPVAWLDRVLAQAEYNLVHYGTDGSRELLSHLQQNRPAAIALTLIHGDFTVDNTLVADQLVTGVIDWAGGTLGDPRYDLALALDDLPDPADQRNFWRGYGEPMPGPNDQHFFIGLYEFF